MLIDFRTLMTNGPQNNMPTALRVRRYSENHVRTHTLRSIATTSSGPQAALESDVTLITMSELTPYRGSY
jgi:hypothetical protein